VGKSSQIVHVHDCQLDLSTPTIRVGTGVGLRALNSLPSPTIASAGIRGDSFVAGDFGTCDMTDQKHGGDRSGFIIAIVGDLGIGASALRSAISICLVDRRLEACQCRPVGVQKVDRSLPIACVVTIS